MTLTAGTRVGSYEVLAKLGEGGMGEVYRARDTKLNRDVAIKVLPDLVADDSERLARFTREAQTLAALNHPNIAHIHAVVDLTSEPARTSALVMELAEGEDLSAIIARGPLPLTEALPIAKQIAEALEAAHELGIVHRDLKPANIKVRGDGMVKVLDFGLAKAMDPAGSGNADMANSPTLTAHATASGIIIGTAAYMAPEQARGRAVDRRADIWAFGAVFYEMLSGRRAFDGDDISITLANVLKEDVQWGALPGDLPAPLHRLLRRCLEKDPKRRLSWIGEARLTLDDPAAVSSRPSPSPSIAAPRESARVWKVATGLLALTTMIAGAAWYRAQADAPAPVRFLVAPPDHTRFVWGANGRTATVPVISPDGRMLAFTAQDDAGRRMLWVRAIDALNAQALTGTEGAGWPFWSPDSRSIGFSAGSRLMKIAAAGGPPLALCALPPNISARGGAWNRDGVIVFNNGPGPLHRITSAGGTSTPLGQLRAGEGGWQFPAFLPDGRHVLYSVTGSQDVAGVYVTALDGGEPKRLLSSDTGAIYDPQSGYLLFGRQGTLMAQTFDPKTFALSGDAVPVAEHLESGAVPGIVAFSLSNTGILAYGTGAASDSASELIWVDRKGTRLGSVGPPSTYRGIDLSPDGTRVAAHRHEGDGGDIWVTDIARGSTSRFTFNAAEDNAAPVWSPEGARIAFSSRRSGKAGIYVKNADNTGDEVRLYEAATIPESMGPQPQSWARDGRFLLVGVRNSGGTAWDLSSLPTSGDGRISPLLNGPSSERFGQLSPDGRWIAYASSETGTTEIYVQPSTLNGGKWAVSAGGGTLPRWRADGRELFYLDYPNLMAVDVTANGAAFSSTTPRALFADNGASPGNHSDYLSYAVASDGQRFLVTRPVQGTEDSPSPIVVVLNWAAGIRR